MDEPLDQYEKKVGGRIYTYTHGCTYIQIRRDPTAAATKPPTGQCTPLKPFQKPWWRMW